MFLEQIEEVSQMKGSLEYWKEHPGLVVKPTCSQIPVPLFTSHVIDLGQVVVEVYYYYL